MARRLRSGQMSGTGREEIDARDRRVSNGLALHFILSAQTSIFGRKVAAGVWQPS